MDNAESKTGKNNYHFQDFGSVGNCLPGTFNYFSELHCQGNKKNSRAFYMETFSLKTST